MKQQCYDTTVVFSKSGILACECDCKAGSKGLDKVVCVHVLPILMQFVVFFIEDLGEHLLIELCNRWSGSLDEKLSSYLNQIKCYILQIMDSIGCASNETSKARLASSIKEMLDSFCVGTEKKKNIPLPPKDDELCPLSDYLTISTCKSLKNILTKKRKKDPRPSHSTTNNTQATFPSEPEVLRFNPEKYNVLSYIVCDFCKIPTKTTSHVCIHEIPNGPRIIEGKNERICGLATCIECKEKYKMHENEHRSSCPIHCKAHTICPSDHPLLEKVENSVEIICHEEEETLEQIPTFPIFTPDYERIKYAIDSIKSVYAGQNLTHDEDEDISEYTGIRVLNLRSLAAIKKMNRREKYIKNETKAMYTKIDKMIK